jgi:hypothetical protein
MKRRVLICASDFGAALGWSTYMSPKDVALKILGEIPKDTVAHQMEIAAKSAAASSSSSVGSRPVSPASVLEKMQVEVARRQSTIMGGAGIHTSALSDQNDFFITPAMETAIMSRIHTNMGCREEPTAIELYTKLHGIELERGGSWLMKPILDDASDIANPTPVFIGGRYDAKYADGSRIIEFKCRQKKFFNLIPMREKAQLYAYMYLTDIKHGIWCQMYNGELRQQDVIWEDKVWDEMKKRLAQFVSTHFNEK